MAGAAPPHRLIFFDGVCGLCNRFVDRLLRLDHHARFRFAPLQGTTARELLPHGMADALNTVVYLRDGVVLVRSEAALRILIDLGGWRVVYRVFFVVPRFLRDAVYNWISRHRYGWFGKQDACRIPTPEERDRFLP
ncbi:MAG: DUF393 domain-containing protein [Flavobacteriales bacterium]|nr:DUF393 domain-containing protein [Flavobacteriales bacterium]